MDDTSIAPNCNIDFVLNGHYHGENRRVRQQLVRRAGAPDRVRLSRRPAGWRRLDAHDDLPSRAQPGGRRHLLADRHRRTRDPDHDGFEEDANSQFTLPYNMAGNAWTQIGTATNVASGGHATVQWNGLQTGTSYEWYAVASDGIFSTQGATLTFSTGGTPNQPPVVDSVVINQTNPKTNDTLSATVTSHDPEASRVTYSYQWLRNGSNISGATNATAEPVRRQQREQGRPDQSAGARERRFAAQVRR